MEYDLDGYAIDASQSYLDRLQLTNEEILHSHFSEGCQIVGWDRAKYNDFWREVRSGKSKRIAMRQNINGTELQLLEFYLPIKNHAGKVYKVIKLSFEV